MARGTSKLTHVSHRGRARMVDVSRKSATEREAIAAATLHVKADAMRAVREGLTAKGNVVETARLAGILAAKKTADLVPLCHPLSLDHVEVDIDDIGSGFDIRARVRTTGKTGVEMEALTAVSVAALTLYDMLKAADRSMVITDIRLMRKSGGRSGVYVRAEGLPASEKKRSRCGLSTRP